MTRKKWNRLRRRRPELFVGLAGTGWEWAVKEVRDFRKRSTREVVGVLTGYQLIREPEHVEIGYSVVGNYEPN